MGFVYSLSIVAISFVARVLLHIFPLELDVPSNELCLVMERNHSVALHAIRCIYLIATGNCSLYKENTDSVFGTITPDDLVLSVSIADMTL